MRKIVSRRNGVLLALVVLMLMLSTVSVLAQTPVPPPTLDELVSAGLVVVAGVAVVTIMVLGGFVFGAAARFITRLVRSGR